MTQHTTAARSPRSPRVIGFFALTLLIVGALLLLGAHPAAATPEQAAARAHLKSLNESRTEAGLPALIAHGELTEVAKDWARVIRIEGSLSHNPDLADLFDSGWKGLAENVAYRQDPSATPGDLAVRLHEDFMGSPGHRANILGDYSHVGIGVELTDNGTMWITVVFAKAATSSTPVDDGGTTTDDGGGFTTDGGEKVTATACPDGAVPDAGFVDIAGNPHGPNIECVAWYGLAHGTGSDTFSPAVAVRRDQMASFVARLLGVAGVDLPETSDGLFGDLLGNLHAESIAQLAALDIVKGTTGSTYAPDESVRRDQMASFLVRAYEHVNGELPAPPSGFTDIQGNPHQTNIDKAAAAGFARGTDLNTYSPAQPVRRDQMASFLARTLERGAEDGHVTPPSS